MLNMLVAAVTYSYLSILLFEDYSGRHK